MKIPIQTLYRIRRRIRALLGLKTRGVKVMVFNAKGELLLVRHTYGDTSQFLLPGGGLRPFEKPPAGARREIKEEVGLRVERLEYFAAYRSRAEGRRDAVTLFTAFTRGTPTSDSIEIAEARFFPLDALPDTVSPATLRRVAEYRGEQPRGGVW